MDRKCIPLLLVLVMILSFSACTRSDTTDEVDLTKAPSPSEIVGECKLASAEVVSFRFRVSIDPPQLFGSTKWEIMEWEIMTTKQKEHVTATLADGSRSESYIWEGHYRCDWRNENGGYWETGALGEPPARSLQELLLFEQIFAGAENLTLVGAETIQGKACFIVEHTRPAGEYGDRHWPSAHTIKVWIDATSYLPLKVTTTWEQTVMTQEFYDYNAPISIEMPVSAPAAEPVPAGPAGFESWAEAAIEWAKGKVGSYEWYDKEKQQGYCLRFVANAFRQRGPEPEGEWNSAWEASQQLELHHEDERFAPPGILIFFAPTKDNPFGHVGIYIGNGEIIHAYGKVRIDSLSSVRELDDGRLIGLNIGWSYPPEKWRP